MDKLHTKINYTQVKLGKNLQEKMKNMKKSTKRRKTKKEMAESSQLTSHKKQINKTFRQLCL